MTTPMKTIGLAMAVSAAGLFATGAIVTATAGEGKKEAKIHCHGVNACRGHNDCAGESNACKGQGSCKGQGFVAMTADTCAQIGGTVKD